MEPKKKGMPSQTGISSTLFLPIKSELSRSQTFRIRFHVSASVLGNNEILPGGSLAAGKASGYPSAADFYGREEIVGLPVCPEGFFGLKDSFHQRKLFATTSKTLTLSGQSLPGELFDKAMNARSSALPGLTLENGYYF
ncbi:uncharacterized protein RSE6_01966 [Rhynchosporium secalis]|uniref:Uncharacterized protein n=1 Tax=Rhynchosporium secalis TaxID=38038 RepID=A0A1E1LZ40_RHYSE|nr:uncharacterized protein RSE6_01966 [Rhynchosporium secalis]